MATKKANPRPWTCRKCKTQHSNRRLRKCPEYGTTRPAKKRRGHMKALDLPYEVYVELNGSENCGICQREPKRDADGNIVRRHDRDHDHKTGRPRGLLCPGRMGCNRKLGRVDDPAWLESAIEFLRRARSRGEAMGL